jgi:hypothetical protein
MLLTAAGCGILVLGGFYAQIVGFVIGVSVGFAGMIWWFWQSFHPSPGRAQPQAHWADVAVIAWGLLLLTSVQPIWQKVLVWLTLVGPMWLISVRKLVFLAYGGHRHPSSGT